MDATSQTLLLRLKQTGEAREVAWGEFRRRYAPIIAGFARNMGANVQEIDDLIQDVMAGFYAAQPSFIYDPDRGRFRGYLKTCVVHLLSKRACERRLSLDGRPVEMIDPADERIEQAWEASWQHEQLQQAIQLVRNHYEDNSTFNAFLRVAIQGEDAAAVATDLDMSVESVYQAKSRCMVRLRSMLKQIEDDEG